MRRQGWVTLVLGTLIWLAATATAAAQSAAVELDGRSLTLDPAARIIDGRTLVPLRQVFETMGAVVVWDGAARTVQATRPGRHVRFAVEGSVACLDTACTQAVLLDVPARIIDDRTFVPLRFLATALGAAVHWDAERRTVVIGSDGPAADSPVSLTAARPGQTVRGPLQLRAQAAQVPAAALRFYLLDPATGRGPLLAITEPDGAYLWRPDPAYSGTRLLAVAAVDAGNRILASDVVQVDVAVNPRVDLTGLAADQLITGPVDLGVEQRFAAAWVSYALRPPGGGPAVELGEGDPDDAFTWAPQAPHSGRWLVQATVYDRLGQAYPSDAIPVVVDVKPERSLVGVESGQTITGRVNLRVRTNYPVYGLQFIWQDSRGAEVVVAAGDSRWVAYPWFPSAEMNGAGFLTAAIRDEDGIVQRTEPMPLTIAAAPRFRITSVGPRQVLSGEVVLQGEANHPFTEIEWRLIDPADGEVTVIAQGSDPGAVYRWTPTPRHAGARRLQAVVRDGRGTRAQSETLEVQVYAGVTYGPQPAMPRERFLAWAAELAVQSYRETGMSAALQVAQAILETGWGQYMPVDKYSGRPSYNLFGIKGTGPAGSVISNTWEEYDGVVYRVDDRFRAYHRLEESWYDHKDLLLTRSWYAPFRAVMGDPVQGAWALRRSGYATDSQYARKLIRIMNENELYALDQLRP